MVYVFLNCGCYIYIYIVPPRWILEPTDKAFAQSSDAKVECKADGFPKPQVTWKKAVGMCTYTYNETKYKSYIMKNK